MKSRGLQFFCRTVGQNLHYNYKRIPLDLEIPRDYPGNTTTGVLRSKAVLALMIVDDEEYDQPGPELGDDVWGTTACIRHTGMVVTYKPFIQNHQSFTEVFSWSEKC